MWRGKGQKSVLRFGAKMIQVRLGLIGFLFISSVAAVDGAPPWLVGLSARDITPNEPVRMAGYGSKEREQPFESVASRLHAKAMAIRDDQGNTGLLITTDVIGLTSAVAAPLYERLTRETELSREQILINSEVESVVVDQVRGLAMKAERPRMPDAKH